MGVQRLVLDGRGFVVIHESEYESLRREAGRLGLVDDTDLPSLPKPDRHGHVPAVEYARAAVARDLIRERRSLGLTQTELAGFAKVRQETISRVESGKWTMTQRTYDKLFNALERVRRGRKRARKA